MMTRQVVCCLIWLGVTVAGLESVSAQEWAKARLEKSPRHQEWVKLKHGKRDVEAFVVYPEVKEKVTAVLVIHEIFGLSDWVRSLTDQIAEAGYIAIAPDMLSGMGPGGGGTSKFESVDAARKVNSMLPPNQVTADLNAAVEYVRKLPACNGKVVVIGFCWGGKETFRFMTNNTQVKAGFVFYGNGPTDEKQIAKIQGPVYGFYGSNDARVNATIAGSVELMKEAGKKYEPVTYEGAGHGFMRAVEAPDASKANSKGREDAWKRLKTLLKAI